MLALVRELGDGRPPHDRFRREAAANYLLRGVLRPQFSRFWTPAFVGAVFTLLGSTAERRHEWVLAWQRPPFPSPWGFAARLERRSPRLGRACRNGVKLARLMVARVVAWPVAAAARVLTS